MMRLSEIYKKSSGVVGYKAILSTGYGYSGSPHVSSGGGGSLAGSGSGLHGLPTTGNGTSHMGSQTIYHLSSLPPPPSISEPGSNSLDDILKAPGESEYIRIFKTVIKNSF